MTARLSSGLALVCDVACIAGAFSTDMERRTTADELKTVYAGCYDASPVYCECVGPNCVDTTFGCYLTFGTFWTGIQGWEKVESDYGYEDIVVSVSESCSETYEYQNNGCTGCAIFLTGSATTTMWDINGGECP